MFHIGTILLLAVYIAGSSALPPCNCYYINAPVCGTDGNTYPNKCILDCQAVNQPQLFVKHEGACEKPRRNPCFCTREYAPVCGTNGVTYSNNCMLRCAAASNSSVEQAYDGECILERANRNRCFCKRLADPVCGSDGVTYANPCVLRCAGDHISPVRRGPC